MNNRTRFGADSILKEKHTICRCVKISANVETERRQDHTY